MGAQPPLGMGTVASGRAAVVGPPAVSARGVEAEGGTDAAGAVVLGCGLAAVVLLGFGFALGFGGEVAVAGGEGTAVAVGAGFAGAVGWVGAGPGVRGVVVIFL